MISYLAHSKTIMEYIIYKHVDPGDLFFSGFAPVFSHVLSTVVLEMCSKFRVCFLCCFSALMENFLVEIDVQSYLTFVDGRRVYRRGKTWDFVVGRDLSVAQITAAVEEQFQWSTD